MNAMFPGRNPLQDHMRWADERQKAWLKLRHDQAGYDYVTRRRTRSKVTVPPPARWTAQPGRGARFGPVSPGVPLPPPPTSFVGERHHPVRAVVAFILMGALTLVAVVVADAVIGATWAGFVAGVIGLVVTLAWTRAAWRDS